MHALLAPAAVAAVRSAGSGYGLKALSVAPRPDAELSQALAAEVQTQLDELILGQGEDGAWWPVWSWGDQHPGAPGERSKLAWAGVLTLEALRSLQAFGRIDRD